MPALSLGLLVVAGVTGVGPLLAVLCGIGLIGAVIAATALEAAKIPQPKMVDGVQQRPMDGVSILYSTDDSKAADRRTTQYFEMFGNRGIYHKGWVACTRHSIPWLMV